MGQGTESVWGVRGGHLRRTSMFRSFERASRSSLTCFDDEVPRAMGKLRANDMPCIGPHMARTWIHDELFRCGWPGHDRYNAAHAVNIASADETR